MAGYPGTSASGVRSSNGASSSSITLSMYSRASRSDARSTVKPGGGGRRVGLGQAKDANSRASRAWIIRSHANLAFINSAQLGDVSGMLTAGAAFEDEAVMKLGHLKQAAASRSVQLAQCQGIETPVTTYLRNSKECWPLVVGYTKHNTRSTVSTAAPN
jgi:hypothetical protein